MGVDPVTNNNLKNKKRMKITFEITPKEVFQLIKGTGNVAEKMVSQFTDALSNLSPEMVGQLENLGKGFAEGVGNESEDVHGEKPKRIIPFIRVIKGREQECIDLIKSQVVDPLGEWDMDFTPGHFEGVWGVSVFPSYRLEQIRYGIDPACVATFESEDGKYEVETLELFLPDQIGEPEPERCVGEPEQIGEPEPIGEAFE